jgi:hypothetical protein
MKMRIFGSIVAAALVAGAVSSPAPLGAQAVPPVSPVVVPLPAAAPADVESIDAILAALYDVISGGVGEARNWERMRSLFLPGGLLMPTVHRADGSVGVRVLDVNDYVALSGPFLERVGFREREIARRTERYGHIAHVFSTYEGHLEAEGTTIRGINSIQLLFDGSRWWVVSVYWEMERPEIPLPAAYLTTPQGG